MIAVAVQRGEQWADPENWDELAQQAVDQAVRQTPFAELATQPWDVEVSVKLTDNAEVQQLNAAYRDKDKLELVVFRGDELITTKIRLEDAPENTCYLQLDKDADADVLGGQAAWLQSG